MQLRQPLALPAATRNWLSPGRTLPNCFLGQWEVREIRLGFKHFGGRQDSGLQCGIVHLPRRTADGVLLNCATPLYIYDAQSVRLRFKWVQYLHHATAQMNHKLDTEGFVYLSGFRKFGTETLSSNNEWRAVRFSGGQVCFAAAATQQTAIGEMKAGKHASRLLRE